MLTCYKILHTVLKFIGILLAINFIASFALITVPIGQISLFMVACVLLYIWFSNRFYTQVVIQNHAVRSTFKDWIYINALISFVFSLLLICSIGSVFINPQVLEASTKMLKTYNPAFTNRLVKLSLGFAAFVALILLTHIVLTIRYMKLFKQYFI